MKVLFTHFSYINDEIEGRELPRYFATRGHTVHSLFIKDVRKFVAKFHVDGNIEQITQDALLDSYDVIVCKSSSYQQYGKNYANSNTHVVNITPMGIAHNLSGVSYGFDVSQLIKPPVKDMRDALANYIPWEKRKDQIVIAASIGTDKNQLEFAKYYDPAILPNYQILFLGTIVSTQYANELKSIFQSKNVNVEFGNVDRSTLARIFLESKFSALTTDPRPAQPYDPSPRVVFESISAGTPCLLSDLVRVHEGSKQFSFFYEHQNRHSFLEMLKRAVNSDLSKLSKESYDYASQEYTLDNACSVAYNDIMEARS
jgi:glycosyltransferase involved in cell wall biosynthesis